MQELSQDLQIVKRDGHSDERNVSPCLAPPKDCHLWTLPEETLKLIEALLEREELFIFLQCSKDVMRRILKTHSVETWRQHFEEMVLSMARQTLRQELHMLHHGLGRLLIELVQEERAVIAGGFVLQHIIGKRFEDTDIDVFILKDYELHPTLTGERLADYYRDSFYQKISDKLGLEDSRSPFHQQPVKAEKAYGMLTPRLDHLIHLTIANLKIQFIHVNGWVPRREHHGLIDENTVPVFNTIEEYIEDQFDLDFCKCWYDGESIGSTHLLEQAFKAGRANQTVLKRHIRSSCPQSLIEFTHEDTQKRIAKYERRGFTVLNKEHLVQIPVLAEEGARDV